MRHLSFGRKLGRDTKARKALLNNLATSLFEVGHFTTTLAKAKFAKAYSEKLITVARKKSIKGHRLLAPKLTSAAFTKLISEIGPGFSGHHGGYTRIVKLQARKGDSAPMARLELLQFEKKPTLAQKKNKDDVKASSQTKKTKSTVALKSTDKKKSAKPTERRSAKSV